MNFDPLSSVCKFECVVRLLIVTSCWGDSTYQLQKIETMINELPSKRGTLKQSEIIDISTFLLQVKIDNEERILTDIRPWPLREDCKSLVNLESR